MSLIEERITDKGVIKYDKVAVAIQTLKDYEQIACQKTDTSGESGYYVCISGGKDSSVIQQLCIMAGVKCVFHHNHTGLDHPETVRFIRREKARLEELGYEFKVDMPAETIWSLVRKKGMLPTRLVRYCCTTLKERGGENRVIVTGVRRAESTNRRNEALVVSRGKTKRDRVIIQNDNNEDRRSVEHCVLKGKIAVNIIVDWSDEDVWEFIQTYNVPVNPLYSMGYTRVGCIGCPMSRNKIQELEAMPKYKAMWMRACEYLVSTPLSRYKTAQELYDWWTEKYKKIEIDENQLSLLGDEEE